MEFYALITTEAVDLAAARKYFKGMTDDEARLVRVSHGNPFDLLADAEQDLLEAKGELERVSGAWQQQMEGQGIPSKVAKEIVDTAFVVE